MKGIRVVFLHHHLRSGGVTKVIHEQIRSLGGSIQPLVIVGEPPPDPVSFPCRIVPSLAYERDRHDILDSEAITVGLLRCVHDHWSGGADLYHIHNPTLGKNRHLNQVIKKLIARKEKILLQIHDFAEDGRPSDYTEEDYPSDCHFGVINRRDHEILFRAGLREEGLHYIPNPVSPLIVRNVEIKEKDVVLYPVRAIRRKNIGEAILLSLFLKEGETIGISLEPTAQLDMASYQSWIEFVKAADLKVIFRLGIESKFEEVIARTRCMITTSMKEGFGLSFLEPWTASRMLTGRILREICSDFTQKGMMLEHLYERISVPLEFIDLQLYYQRWKKCFREKLDKYGLPCSADIMDEYLHNATRGGTVDFGYLDEGLQMKVLRLLSRDKNNQKKLLALNPFLENITSFENESDVIERNKKIVEGEYSLKKNKSNLMKVYAAVMDRSVRHSIDKRVLLEVFNTPDKNLLLLCSTGYD
jgi:hypothetical protein